MPRSTMGKKGGRRTTKAALCSSFHGTSPARTPGSSPNRARRTDSRRKVLLAGRRPSRPFGGRGQPEGSRCRCSLADIYSSMASPRRPRFPRRALRRRKHPEGRQGFQVGPLARRPRPRDIVSTEAGMKLCGVQSKVKVTGVSMQYGFHDGRSLLDDTLAAACGDTVMMNSPSGRGRDAEARQRGRPALVVSGERARTVGTIISCEEGNNSREKMVALSLPSGETDLPREDHFGRRDRKTALEVQAKPIDGPAQDPGPGRRNRRRRRARRHPLMARRGGQGRSPCG